MRPARRRKLAWSAAFAAAAVWVARDYARWRSLGQGGLPANLRGWLQMWRFRLMAVDGLDVRPILSPPGRAHDLQSWAELIRRDGERPTVSPYPIPHRQLDQLPHATERADLALLFDRKVLEHAGTVHYVLSHFEKRNLAITLISEDGTVGSLSHGEIAHIHPTDSSMHMILSPSDAVTAIKSGWAQRHGLAGIAVDLPATYVMVYAPRNSDDLKVVETLLDAAIAYALQPLTLPTNLVA